MWPWLPNAITVFRILLIPAFLWSASTFQEDPSAGSRVPCVIVLVLLGISDVLDGWLARRYGLGSILGATLDALADKLTQVALLTFFALAEGPTFTPIPIWFLILIVARDLLLGLGWLVIRRRRRRVDVVHASHGKVASLLMFLLLGWLTMGFSDAVVTPAVLVVGGIVVLSTVDYVRAGWRQFKTVR